MACKNGDDSIVKCLLENGADINLCTKDGRSPSYIAHQYGHQSTVRLLSKLERTSIYVQRTEPVLSLQLVKTDMIALCNFYRKMEQILIYVQRTESILFVQLVKAEHTCTVKHLLSIRQPCYVKKKKQFINLQFVYMDMISS